LICNISCGCRIVSGALDKIYPVCHVNLEN
jgi:hypothetical protein